MSLKATVQSLRERADDARLSEQDQLSFIAAWRRDVSEVYASIRAALDEELGSDVLTFTLEPFAVSEEQLGDYQSERLMIAIVNRVIRVEPVARMTIGGTGRIDMYRADRPSEENRTFLVRGTAESDHVPSVWLIEAKRADAVGGRVPRPVSRGHREYMPLSPQTIRDAVDSLLRLT